MSYQERIDALMGYLLFTDEELVAMNKNGPVAIPAEGVEAIEGFPADSVLVRGLINGYGFSKTRAAEKKEEIRALIKEIVQDDFLVDKGGGMSFLNLCNDRNGAQWTGEHRTMEALLCLGLAVDIASYCLPRDFWGALPGGVPYVVFDP